MKKELLKLAIAVSIFIVPIMQNNVLCAAQKTVTFYPTYGYPDGENWHIPVRLWVYEPAGMTRRGMAKIARRVLAGRAGLESLTSVQKEVFISRAEGFIADSESRETVYFSFNDDPIQQRYLIVNADGRSKTDRNGRVEGELILSRTTIDNLLIAQAADSTVSSTSVVPRLNFTATDNKYSGEGAVSLIPQTGLSVVSDIDDTIKITEIPAGEAAILRNTFFKEFSAAPCMAGIYQDLVSESEGAGVSVVFHYVSGAPWQLYQPIADFIFSGAGGYPYGSIHMKDVRTNPFESESYSDIWKLIVDGSYRATFNQKTSQISELLKQFPAREFILIGDSGEQDPEIYRALKNEFKNQIRQIIIRDVKNSVVAEPERLQGMSVIADNIDC